MQSLLPERFEYTLGLFVALKKQLEDEEKARKKAEDEQNGNVDVSGYMGQANSMINSAKNSIKMPSMPSIPH